MQPLLMAAIINRLVELIKEIYPQVGTYPRFDRARRLITLLTSFGLGSIGVIVFFSSMSLFPDANTALADQIATGIVIGGVANGYDWLAEIITFRVVGTTLIAPILEASSAE